MQLLTLSAVLLLISSSYGADITTLADGILQNPLAYSAIIALPTDCKYSGKSANLYITGAITQNILIPSLPQCRFKRDIVVVNNPQDGNIDTVNVGYRIDGLNPNKTYTAQYVIDGTTFNSTTFTTPTVSDPEVIFRRSGGMVVITVILSIAMFMLLAGLIAVLVLGGRGAK